MKHLYNRLVCYSDPHRTPLLIDNLNKTHSVLAQVLTSTIRDSAFVQIHTSRLGPILEPFVTLIAVASKAKNCRLILPQISTRSMRRTPCRVFLTFFYMRRRRRRRRMILFASFRRFVVDAIVTSTLACVRSFGV